ncbi:hypothetical protein ABZU76_15060 [Amycolatopsis sp. NPDC005232]|uniref:hypothetical protein n=1 Tax=Amycolatopsis sp. NPDC005232 TaxID=3157027 RepID=UPI0033BE9A62
MLIRLRESAEDTVETIGKGDVHYRVDNVFGHVTENRPGPQVFLVHQAAGDITAPHYHAVPQFQVFTTGEGRFGRSSVTTPAIHYADAWTSYGPIIAGERGIDYFTARVHADVGAKYMPESRKLKPHRSGRHFTVTLAASPRPGLRTLIEPHDDGLAAYQCSITAGQSLKLPAPRGSGRLLTILTGTLLAGGHHFAQWSWGHVEDAAASAGWVAGAEGATVLCFDYPAFALS